MRQPMTIHNVYSPFLKHFRRQRIRLFLGTLKLDSSTRILDVGGNSFFWERLAPVLGTEMPQVTVLNLYERPASVPPFVRWMVGDGRRLPFDDGAFDLAFSNSVIEHLGTIDSQMAFASEIRRVAEKYWVQTPDCRFFVEPHYITPFVHWLPKGVQRVMLRWCTVWGLVTRPTPEEIEKNLNEIRLLGPREFRLLFPDAEILVERFLGLPKSLIALRRSAPQGGFSTP